MSRRPLRRAQAISPFGIGAMVDFPGPESLIHCGLDAWPFSETNQDHREFKIDDESRLARRLGVEYFVMPPDYRYPSGWATSGQPNLNLRLPFLRFPLWHVCPRCGRMHKSALHDKSAPWCKGPIGSGAAKGKPHKKRKTIQVRFVAACMDGHLQDFPWWEWLLRTPNPAQQGRLRMQSSGSASLAGVRVLLEAPGSEINVLESRTLAGAFQAEPPAQSALSAIGVQCNGENPCLGTPSATQEAPGCGQHLYPLLRGSASVYFPQVASSIYLPPLDPRSNRRALEILEDRQAWRHIQAFAAANGDGRVSARQCAVVLTMFHPDKEVPAEELAEAANRRLAGDIQGARNVVRTDTPEQRFRRQEYDVLGGDVEEGYPKTNLLIRSADIMDYDQVISDSFAQISLVHKLRETRAFVGFSRVLPRGGPDNRPDPSLFSRDPKPWLPATMVRGEGIFLQLREDRVQQWLKSAGSRLSGRIDKLAIASSRSLTNAETEHGPVTPRLILLHTLAHLLINELIFECGYGSASLRERLYTADGAEPMAGILIYTAAGDSEGTMGGLVRMGRPGRLEAVLQTAVERGRWCSTDPVCIESTGQGPDSCNLAACHCCALLPETSCELQNRLLDRAVIVGGLGDRSLGFFGAA